MTFGEKLKEARQKAGFTQEQLAETMSVSRSAVAKWESDKGLPDINNLKAIAKLLDVSVDYLLDDGTTLDISVIKEPIDLSGVKGLVKKAKKKDEIVAAKFSGFDIYPLNAVKSLSGKEKFRDNAMSLFTAFLPGTGSFDSGTDIVNAIDNLNNAYYLAEDGRSQFFIICSNTDRIPFIFGTNIINIF